MKYFVNIYTDGDNLAEEFTMLDLGLARLIAKTVSELEAFPRVTINNSTGFHTEVWEDGIKTY